MMCTALRLKKNKMPYNPKIHHRRSIRLKGYDYSQAGAYFITICVQDRKCLFGDIKNDKIELNEFGKISYHEWEKLSGRFTNIELDVFQIMPNHMHGIIVLNDLVGATLAVAQNDNAIVPDNGATARVAPTGPAAIGNIVGAYKSLAANECLKIFKSKYPGKTMGKLWQRNYYEHIIRDEQSYHRISEYIIDNPKNWKGDKFF